MTFAWSSKDLPLSIEECDGSEDELHAIGKAILTTEMVNL
jgi:hypothetical protein